MTWRGSANEAGAAVKSNAITRTADNNCFITSSCRNEVRLALCRRATPRRCLSAFRWRRGPRVRVGGKRGWMGRMIHPWVEYNARKRASGNLLRMFPERNAGDTVAEEK